MGEAADLMLSGVLCAGCGEYLDGEETGHPRYCENCDETPVRLVIKNGKAKRVGIQSGMQASKKVRKTIKKSEAEKLWPLISAEIKRFAGCEGLTVEWRNPNAPHYEIAFLRGEGVRLCIYPHRTKTTGNQHVRIRDQSSPDKARARDLLLSSGFTIKSGGLPEMPDKQGGDSG